MACNCNCNDSYAGMRYANPVFTQTTTFDPASDAESAGLPTSYISNLNTYVNGTTGTKKCQRVYVQLPSTLSGTPNQATVFSFANGATIIPTYDRNGNAISALRVQSDLNRTRGNAVMECIVAFDTNIMIVRRILYRRNV